MSYPACGHVFMRLEVSNICVNEAHLDEPKQGRYDESGYLYNAHYPVNPETYDG